LIGGSFGTAIKAMGHGKWWPRNGQNSWRPRDGQPLSGLEKVSWTKLAREESAIQEPERLTFPV
jgi:hypothetical protein